MPDNTNTTYHVYGGNADELISIESTSDIRVSVTKNPNVNPMADANGRRMRRTSLQARL